MRVRMTLIFCRSMVCAGCLGLSACAALGVFSNGADKPPFSNPTLSMQNASDSVVAGTTSKADVVAALGPATMISFDSGYEVWVYRAKSRGSAENTAEFVVLFTPDGVVKRTRIRPAGIAGN